MRITTTISLDGPMFSADPTKSWDENVRRMMEAVAKEGEADVKAKLEQGQASRAELSIGGRLSEHVRGRVESLEGHQWHRTAVVGIPKVLPADEQIAVYAAESIVESRSHIFRASANRMRRAKSLNMAELLTL